MYSWNLPGQALPLDFPKVPFWKVEPIGQVREMLG